MSRIGWNAAGSRMFEAGVDRGVLFVAGRPGVPWNGLTSVVESPSGGDVKSYYIDGVKYLAIPSPEEFEGTINAFMYPDEFALCNGQAEPRAGLFLTHQRRQRFSFSYRTMIGNEVTESLGYKLHIIYNALASPSERNNQSYSDRMEPLDFSWKITCVPPAMSHYRPTSHVVLDSRTTDASVMSLVEDIIYGTDADSPRLPSLDELIAAYDTISSLTVIDNGDGTWTATAPFDVIRMIDDETFEITAPTANFTGPDTYTISSE